MKNKFRIVIGTYNNQEWAEYNIKSVLNQTYKNFEVYCVDDCSTDDTPYIIQKIVRDDQRFSFFQNEKNMGAVHNYRTYFTKDLEDDNTILCLLDGDDWLHDITVLEKLNDFYNRGDYWMTYGGMVVYTDSGIVEANPHNSPYSEDVHRTKTYRKDLWRASHFRTYRAFLWKAIQEEDFREMESGDYYNHAADLGSQFPCLEMCPFEKIGVAPFKTYVYNSSTQNMVRTYQRQFDNKHWFIENEIRNRKVYREGIGNGKYYQVNIIGNSGYEPISGYRPKDVTYVSNLEKGVFDISLVTDFEIPKYISGLLKIGSGKIVADLYESRNYSDEMSEIYSMVNEHHNMFDRILTYDEDLLKLPNAKLRLPMSTLFLTSGFHTNKQKLEIEDVVSIYPKSKNVSCISSNKSFLEGHKRRMQFLKHICESSSDKFDMYGEGFKFIETKLDILRDYKFSIAIENGSLKNMATEKLSDCFLTGTIPIYYGCPNVSDFFDIDGIFTFADEVELEEIINHLHVHGEEEYKKRYESIVRNFEISKKYAITPENYFTQNLKDLISN